MNFSFVSPKLILILLVGVFIFGVWSPEPEVSLEQKFVFFGVVFVVVFFVLPFVLERFGQQVSGWKQIGDADLKDFDELESEIKFELSRNGFFELFRDGYRLSFSMLRKSFGIATISKHGVQKYYCVYDGLKNSNKILIAGAESQHELLRMFGVKNLKELGEVLMRQEQITAKDWLKEGEKFGFGGLKDALGDKI